MITDGSVRPRIRRGIEAAKVKYSAVATGLCWLGMVAVFSVTFSGMVISSDHRYGPIGIALDLLSYALAIGVVIILGAVLGIVWQERGLSFRAAAGKLRRAR